MLDGKNAREGGPAEERDQPVRVVPAVRWVGEGHVVGPGTEPLHEPDRVAPMHRGPPRDAQGRDVGLEGLERRRIELHEPGGRRARERASRPSAPLPA